MSDKATSASELQERADQRRRRTFSDAGNVGYTTGTLAAAPEPNGGMPDLDWDDADED